MGQSVPAQSLGPDEVVLYSAQDFAGPAERWQLPAGRLFLSVPFVGEALNQNVASAQVGSEVAVLLFQRPYFTSKDEACGPQIGTDEQPAAWWLGLTAQNLPPPPLQGFAPYSSPRLENGHIGSMIIYRRDLGPPPGALLLERRSYYNRDCVNLLHSSTFNRIFVPVPDGPERTICRNLSEPAASPGAGEEPTRFRRVNDLFLMKPSRLDLLYQPVNHSIKIKLFDGPDCTGAAVSFPRLRGREESFRLSDYEFRDKTRSVQVTYEGGAASAAYATGKAATQGSKTDQDPESDQTPAAQPAQAPAESGATPVASAPPATPVVPVVETPIEAPSAPQAQADVTQGDAQPQTTAPDTTFSFQTPPTSPPVSQPQPSADQAQAPLAPQAQAVVPQGAAQPQTTEPASTFSFQTPSSAAPSESAPEPSNGQVEAPAVPQVQAGQASTFSLQPSAPAPQEESELPGTYGQIQGDIPIVPEAPRILPDGASSPQTADQAPIFSLQPPPPAPLPETDFFSGTGQAQDVSPDLEPQSEPSPSEIPQQPAVVTAVPSIPNFGTTSPSQPQAGAAQLPSETQAAVQPTPEPPLDPGGQVFRYPSYRQYRLNYCYRWRKDCGQPAAEAWCKAVGFNRAVSWKKEAHVGAIFPTIVMAEKRLCDKYLCDGFEQIVCGR